MAYMTGNTILFPVLTFLKGASLASSIFRMTSLDRQVQKEAQFSGFIFLLKVLNLLLNTLNKNRLLFNYIARIIYAIEKEKSVPDSDPGVSVIPECLLFLSLGRVNLHN